MVIEKHSVKVTEHFDGHSYTQEYKFEDIGDALKFADAAKRAENVTVDVQPAQQMRCKDCAYWEYEGEVPFNRDGFLNPEFGTCRLYLDDNEEYEEVLKYFPAIFMREDEQFCSEFIRKGERE